MLWVIASVSTLFMLAIAFAVDRSLPASLRVPMQWGASGKANWTAPRRVGIYFFPALALIFMIFYIVLMETSGPKAGQEDLVLPVMLFSAIMFIGIQCAHFALAKRDLRKNGPR